MQHAIVSLRYYPFPPGLLVVVEFVAPEHVSPTRVIVPDRRGEEKHDIRYPR